MNKSDTTYQLQNRIIPSGLELDDVTLRDGNQGIDVHFSAESKLKIAREIDRCLPVNIIEGGWPGANDTDTEFFKKARQEKFHHKLSAFGMTRRADMRVQEDPAIRLLIDSEAPVITFVGKTNTTHIQLILRTTLEENLRMIEESVRFAVTAGRKVIFDAEHFFDGANVNESYAKDVLYAAARGGADCVVLCDTNGGQLPMDVKDRVGQIVNDRTLRSINPNIRIGIHTHNDRNFGDANALAAVLAGATHVQATANGLGERRGNANMFNLIETFRELGMVDYPSGMRKNLKNLSDLIYEMAGVKKDPFSPYTGDKVFSTKSGMHQDGLIKFPKSYTFIDPKDVGNTVKIIIDNQSGRKGIEAKIKQLDIPVTINKKFLDEVVKELKSKENEGYRYARADASFELLVRRRSEVYKKPFAAINEPSKDFLYPNTIFDYMKNELIAQFPYLHTVRFVKCKEQLENNSIYRTLIIATDGNHTWETVGVGDTLKQAAVEAISDSFEYALLNKN